MIDKNGSGMLRGMVASAAVLMLFGGMCVADEWGDWGDWGDWEETDDWSRQLAGEIYVVGQMVGSDTVTYGGIAEDEIDSFTAYGIGVGISQGYFAVNTEFLMGSTSEVWAGSVEADADIWFWNVNVDWNVLPTRLTPVLTGGVGLVNMEGESGDGTTYEEDTFTYNLGAGGRWDITDHIVIKVIYRITWGEFESADEANQFEGLLASVGYVFR